MAIKRLAEKRHAGRWLAAKRQRRRKGTAALEEVMILAVFMPIAAGCFFLCMKFSSAIFEVVSDLVGWPYL